MRGAETFARLYNTPVIFATIRKKERGIYEVDYSEICSDPNEWEENAITREHTRRLEELILEAPEYWLWSHKRWKKKKPAGISLE